MTTAPHPQSTDSELVEWLRGCYRLVRVLPDGSIAGLDSLMFTTGIMLGMTRWGYETRFCFESPKLAEQRFYELQSQDDEPEGWIARRPEPPGFYDLTE